MKAIITVSGWISEGEFVNLSGLVKDDSIEKIKRNFSKLNDKQKASIRLNFSGMSTLFPYQFNLTQLEDKHLASISVLAYHESEDPREKQIKEMMDKMDLENVVKQATEKIPQFKMFRE